MSKRGKDHKRWGVWEMFEMQKVTLRMQEYRENSLIHQYFLNFEKNLLVNITKGALFFSIIKY